MTINKVKIEGENGWNSIFPDSKSEIHVDKGIENPLSADLLFVN